MIETGSAKVGINTRAMLIGVRYSETFTKRSMKGTFSKALSSLAKIL